MGSVCQLIHGDSRKSGHGLNFDEEKVPLKKLKILPSTIQTVDALLSAQTCVMAEEQKLIPSTGAVVRAAHKYGVEVPWPWSVLFALFMQWKVETNK